MEDLDAIYARMIFDRRKREQQLQSIGIFIDFVKPIVFNNKKVWALGNRIYYERPEKETFHEFLLFVLIHQALGEDWWNDQASLPESGWHHIYRCFKKYQTWALKNQQEENYKGESWSAFPDGWSRSLLSLAFDVASLLHAEHLPEDILNRLKSYEEYQSSRYEIAVSAIFARLGYRIEFLNEKKVAGKHCEFFAHDQATGEIIAVEAKSRERRGVLHVDGTYNGEYWAHIQRFRRKALTQNPGDRPFLIFYDINAPQVPEKSSFEKPWIKEVRKLHDKLPLNTLQSPDPCSGDVFTNYAFHFQTDSEATAGEYLLTVPLHPLFPIKKPQFWNQLQDALNNYGNVPNLDIEYGE